MHTKNKAWIFIPSAIVLLLVVVSVLIHVFPVLQQAFAAKDASILQDYLLGFGWHGIFIAYILQILQIISIVIPAPTMPLLTGATYGLWPGILISVAGIVSGNLLVFLAARRLHVKSLPAFLIRHTRLKDTGLMMGLDGQTLQSEENIANNTEQPKRRLLFSKDSKKLRLILFCVYLIPVIPNGMIPYLAALTPVSAKHFVNVVSLACLPSVLFSTFAGHRIIGGDITTAAILAGIAIVCMAVILLFRKRILARLHKMSEED